MMIYSSLDFEKENENPTTAIPGPVCLYVVTPDIIKCCVLT